MIGVKHALDHVRDVIPKQKPLHFKPKKHLFMTEAQLTDEP